MVLINNLALSASAVESKVKDYNFPKNELDIMFVLDVSGSMKITDPDRVSIEIIKMLVDLFGNGNTKMGFVAYNHSISSEATLKKISGDIERKELKNRLDQIRFQGDTDIGLGLSSAVDILAESKKKDRASIVILVSDGETDLPDEKYIRTNSMSEKDIISSIDKAKKNNIAIHTIGMTNHFDGKVDSLKNISEKTEGKFYTANSPFQLFDILNDIIVKYKNLNLLSIKNLMANGKEQKIMIKDVDPYMSEFNLIVFSDKPLKESKIDKSGKDVNIVRSKYYSMIHIINPNKENLELTIRGENKGNLKIAAVGDYPFCEAISTPANIYKNNVSQIHFYFKNSKTKRKLKEPDIYKKLKATLFLKNVTTNEIKQLPLRLGEAGMETEITPSAGKYEMYIQYTSLYMNGKTKKIKFETVNRLPQKAESLEFKIVKNNRTRIFDIKKAFYDKDGEELTYYIETVDKADKDVVLEDGKLIVTPEKVGKNIYSIRAVDTEGGECKNEVIIHNLPLFKYYHKEVTLCAIIIIIILTVFICIILVKKHRKALQSPPAFFEGTFTGYFLNLKSNREIPPIRWELSGYSRKGITLHQLFINQKIPEHFSETNRIKFRPVGNKKIEVKHNTNCVILIGANDVLPNIAMEFHIGEKMYICFEDTLSELEIRYK